MQSFDSVGVSAGLSAHAEQVDELANPGITFDPILGTSDQLFHDVAAAFVQHRDFGGLFGSRFKFLIDRFQLGDQLLRLAGDRGRGEAELRWAAPRA